MPTGQIAFELAPDLEGIGMPPNLIMNYGTQYGKIAKIELSENTFIADRLVPVPYSKHASNKVYISQAFEKQLELDTSRISYCTIIEPDFVQQITIKEINEESLLDFSPVIKPISDKSVVYQGMFLRHKNNKIYQVIELPDKKEIGILTGGTKLDIQAPPDSSEEDNKTDQTNDDKGPSSFSLSEFSNDSTSGLEYTSSTGNHPTTFGNLNKLKGIDHVIKRLMMEVILPFQDVLDDPNSKHKIGACMFYGPPGCGKTALVKAVANDLQLPFYNVKIGDLSSPYVHQFAKNLNLVFSKAASNKGGAIIFLDELDAYAGHRKNMTDPHDKENVNALLQELDPVNLPSNVLVFGATNYISSLDTAVIRSGRFDTKIPIPPPDSTGRAFIMRQKLQDLGVSLGDITDSFINTYTSEIQGFVGADIDSLVKKAFSFAKMESRINRKEIVINKSHIKDANDAILPQCQTELGISKPTITKSDLPGSEAFIDSIHDDIKAILHPEKFRTDIDYKPNLGFILHGPTGTGKTSIANAIAHEANLLFKVIKGTEIVDKYIGVGQSKIRELFEQAELYQPIMIFIDEIDSIAKSRSGEFSNDHEDILNALMSEIDTTEKDNKVVVVGATNHLKKIDSALLRPGRLGTHYLVARPDIEQIEKIVHHLLVGIPNALNKEHISKITSQLFEQKKTQSQIADYFNQVKRHLLYHTKKGESADFSVFTDLLTQGHSDEN